jgi:branched-chain amino acid aminotransferase
VPGIEVLERELSVDELFLADEVFITSSTRDLLAVREIAGRPVSRRGDVRERLSGAFQQFVRADIAGRKRALTVA